MSFLGTLSKTVADSLFPRRCPLCGVALLPSERICGKCADDLVFIYPPICRYCGRPRFDCTCRNQFFDFERTVAPFVYTKSVRKGIHRMKFSNAPSNAKFFGKMMTACVRREYPDIHFDLITCVPMHPDDKALRGYNQAALLAESIAGETGIKLCATAMSKRVRNNTQHSLARAERVKNVEGVFRVDRADLVRGSTILLCDDIMTTGSTLNECARVLKAAGAREVYCITAATVCQSAQGNVKKAYVQ